ncbi:MAG: hypothetical protein AAB561_01130 [Patescibacteria group bacterium]
MIESKYHLHELKRTYKGLRNTPPSSVTTNTYGRSEPKTIIFLAVWRTIVARQPTTTQESVCKSKHSATAATNGKCRS